MRDGGHAILAQMLPLYSVVQMGTEEDEEVIAYVLGISQLSSLRPTREALLGYPEYLLCLGYWDLEQRQQMP